MLQALTTGQLSEKCINDLANHDAAPMSELLGVRTPNRLARSRAQAMRKKKFPDPELRQLTAQTRSGHFACGYSEFNYLRRSLRPSSGLGVQHSACLSSFAVLEPGICLRHRSLSATQIHGSSSVRRPSLRCNLPWLSQAQRQMFHRPRAERKLSSTTVPNSVPNGGLFTLVSWLGERGRNPREYRPSSTRTSSAKLLKRRVCGTLNQ